MEEQLEKCQISESLFLDPFSKDYFTCPTYVVSDSSVQATLAGWSVDAFQHSEE